MADKIPENKGASGLMRIVLVVSLALNLAVAGLLVGAAVSGRLSSGPPQHVEFGFGPIGRALGPEERRDIRRSLRQGGSVGALNLRGGMEQMIAAMQADPFDLELIHTLMAAQIAKTTQLQGDMQEALLQVIADMTPERRATFAVQLKDQMSRDRPRRDRPSGG